MTIKTPEQIAEEQTKLEHDSAMYTLDYMREQIVAAIEADRAQRLTEAHKVLARYDRDPSNANLHDAVGALRNIVEGKA